MAASLPRRLFMVSGPAHSRSICLTFDDGPDPEHTPNLLAVLKALHVRATFFLIGAKAARHPDLVNRMFADGHEIGHHSYTHGDPERTSAPELIRESRQTSALLRELSGHAPRLFRPPHGKLTLAKTLGLWASGQTIVLWNRDPKDFSGESATHLPAWFRESPLRPGDIVLLHDTRPFAAEALPVLVERLGKAGIGFATPSEWLKHVRA